MLPRCLRHVPQDRMGWLRSARRRRPAIGVGLRPLHLPQKFDTADRATSNCSVVLRSVNRCEERSPRKGGPSSLAPVLPAGPR